MRHSINVERHLWLESLACPFRTELDLVNRFRPPKKSAEIETCIKTKVCAGEQGGGGDLEYKEMLGLVLGMRMCALGDDAISVAAGIEAAAERGGRRLGLGDQQVVAAPQ